jgi:hypothetical protein
MPITIIVLLAIANKTNPQEILHNLIPKTKTTNYPTAIPALLKTNKEHAIPDILIAYNSTTEVNIG